MLPALGCDYKNRCAFFDKESLRLQEVFEQIAELVWRTRRGNRHPLAGLASSICEGIVRVIAIASTDTFCQAQISTQPPAIDGNKPPGLKKLLAKTDQEICSLFINRWRLEITEPFKIGLSNYKAGILSNIS